jgi:hypothetical protein
LSSLRLLPILAVALAATPWLADDVARADLPIFDNTPPDNVQGTPDRPPDVAGWYSHSVTFTYTGTDADSGIASCDQVTYDGPDSKTAHVTGGCTDNAGNRSVVTDGLQYDGTKPVVSGASPERAPDHDGWYTRPVSFGFQGTDETSGVVACSRATYSGPDDGTAQLSGSCTDAAGNVGTRTISLKYDATPPATSKPFAVPGNRSIGVSWAPPADADTFVVIRVPVAGGRAVTVYRGKAHDFVDVGVANGKRYTYEITTFDAAGNPSAPATISAVPDGSTLRPFLDTEVSHPPTLTWGKARGARYYNVQLYRGNKKVLSRWPKIERLRIRAKWHFNGREYRLKPGLYRWYVWPGLGRTTAHRYGTMVGSSTFRVSAR